MEFLCRFEYNAASDLVKEIEFEEVEGKWQKFCSSFSFSLFYDHKARCVRGELSSKSLFHVFLFLWCIVFSATVFWSFFRFYFKKFQGQSKQEFRGSEIHFVFSPDVCKLGRRYVKENESWLCGKGSSGHRFSFPKVYYTFVLVSEVLKVQKNIGM